jgi:pimeloyl-ACP methyl ester carboxylesterase
MLKDVPAATPVVLLGASEGGDVASAIAALEPRITHLVLIGCGGGWSQAQELAHELETRGSVLGIDSRQALEGRFEAIRARPDSLELWAGHPYRRWSSYLWSPPLDDLVRVTVPVFLAHGSADTNVPVGSARALAEAFWARGKTNLRYREYEGLDHRLVDVISKESGFPRLEADLVGWFADQGLVTKIEAAAMIPRIRRAHPAAFNRVPRSGR